MSLLQAIGLLSVGLAVLVLGAEWLVRGASGLAARLGVSPLVIGLTIVAFGTSSPELAVSVKAVWAGQADVSVGNVVGSNIFNVLFILGVSSLVAPLVVDQKLVRIDVPLMIGASVLLAVLVADGALGRLDGAVLFAGIVAYTAAAIRTARRESAQVKAEYATAGAAAPAPRPALVLLVLLVAGLALCVLGSRWLVDGAVQIARAMGVSELVIGLTIVAAGTSLPEVATSVLAAARGQRDLAVGNVVGSNLFNIFGILGTAALVAPGPVPVADAVRGFDLPVMIAAAVACLPILFTGHRIDRWEGALLMAAYLAYAAYLVLGAIGHGAAAPFGRTVLWFALPVAALGVAFSVVHALRRPSAGRTT